MTTLRHWSNRYITRAEGDNIMWVRGDYVEKLQAALIASGKKRTGISIVTGNYRYIQFRTVAAA